MLVDFKIILKVGINMTLNVGFYLILNVGSYVTFFGKGFRDPPQARPTWDDLPAGCRSPQAVAPYPSPHIV